MFFVCLILAGLTSMISIVEVVISSFQDKVGGSRIVATLVVGIPMAVVSIMLMPTQTGLQNLDIMDKFANSLGIVGIALVALISIMFVFRLGPTLRDHLNSVSSFKVGPIWIICMAVVTPIVLAYSLSEEIISLIQEPYGGYESAVINTWGWGMIAAILVLSVILTLLPWRGATHLDGPPATDDDPSDALFDEQFSSSSSSLSSSSDSTAPSTGPPGGTEPGGTPPGTSTPTDNRTEN